VAAWIGNLMIWEESCVSKERGAASGMGAATARRFAKEGAKVVIADMLEEEGRQVAADITRANGTAEFMRLDVTSENDWKAVVEATVQKYGITHSIRYPGTILVQPSRLCAAYEHFRNVEQRQATNPMASVLLSGVLTGGQVATQPPATTHQVLTVTTAFFSLLTDAAEMPAIRADKGTGRSRRAASAQS
jgi:NAD(P)-dependent dehydrogenase (short-subunit alcohol dehydrogenase family)